MSWDQRESRTLALLQAVRFFGSELEMAEQLEVSESCVSRWISDPTREIPYKKLLKIEKLTGISIRRLAPDEEEINDYINNRGILKNLYLQDIFRKEVITQGCFARPDGNPERPIIVDFDFLLISGSAMLNASPNSEEMSVIQVVMIDTRALLKKTHFLSDLKRPLLLSERAAIGLCAGRLLANRSGHRRYSGSRANRFEEDKGSSMRSICYEVMGRTDDIIAELVDFTSKETYRRATRVYLHGIGELVDALDHQKISIARAARIAELEPEQQHQELLLEKPQVCKWSILKGEQDDRKK